MFRHSIARVASLVYFVQGALGISAIALPLYMRAAGLSIKDIALSMAIISTPWFAKIIYGAISDSYPISGKRRKPYIILYSVLSCFGWIILAIVPFQKTLLIISLWIANVGFAATDVVTDGLVVENSDRESARTYQGLCWGSRSAGAVITGILGGYLALKLNYRAIFALTACLPVLTLIVALFIKEEPYQAPQIKNVFLPIIDSLRLLIKVRQPLFWLGLLLFTVAFSASFGTPLFFFMKEKLKFNELYLGTLASITWVGTIIGTFVYLKWMKRISLHTTLRWAVIINSASALFCLLILKFYSSAFFLFLIGGLLGYLSFLPLMTCAARLTNRTKVESSLFAILMSLHNLGMVSATGWGGFMFERIGLVNLICLSGAIGLIGLLFVNNIHFDDADNGK